MKNILFGASCLFIVAFCSSGFKNGTQKNECTCNKDSMQVVMRFEIKVKPEKVAFLKESFDACKVEVMAQEPGCLDYSLFQSYNDSTRFCLTEAWACKADHNAHMQLEHTKKHIAETRDIKDRSFRSETAYVYWICPCANEKK